MKNSLPVCPSCNVAVGEYHRPRCRFEICPHCGHFLNRKDHRHGCSQNRTKFWPMPLDDRILWDGADHFSRDCVELGYLVRSVAGKMVCCAEGDPGAQPDFIRLFTEATWDKDQQRFVRSLPTPREETAFDNTPIVVPPPPPGRKSAAAIFARLPHLTRRCRVCRRNTKVANDSTFPLCERCAITAVPQAIAHAVIVNNGTGALEDRLPKVLAEVQDNLLSEFDRLARQVLKESMA